MAVMKRVFCLAIALVLCLSMGAAFAAEDVISFEEFMGMDEALEALINEDEEALAAAVEEWQAAMEAQGQEITAESLEQPGVVPQVEVEGEQRVFDLAGLFSEEERAQLEQRIADLRQSIRPYDAAVLTADNGVYDTKDYADRFYEDHGIGTDANRSGVLFFLDMQNRTVWISTAGDLIGIISDSREQEIFYEQDYYLGNGDWAGAMMVALDKTEEFVQDGVQDGMFIYDESTGELTENQEQYTDLHDSEYYRRQAIEGVVGNAGMGGVLGGLAGLITRGSIKRKYGKKYEPVRYEWERKSSLNLTANQSTITNKFVTTRVIPRQNDNNGSMGGFGGSGGGGIHMSSGGMSHGGGGHKF